MLNQVLSRSSDTVVIAASNGRGITLVPTFQRGYVPNVIDSFRFTLNFTGAIQMPTKTLGIDSYLPRSGPLPPSHQRPSS